MPKYTFSIDRIEIADTRSRHEDTIYACISVAVAGRQPWTSSRRLGDHNNGTFNPGLVLDNVPIEDKEIAVFSYIIVNNGHSEDTVVDAAIRNAATSLARGGANAAAGAISSTAGAAVGAWLGGFLGSPVPIVGTIVGAALGALTGTLLTSLIDVINPNCDGPLASAVIPIPGQGLRERLDAGQQFSQRDYNPGIDSPSGCGSNSRYWTTWSVKKAP
jgi:hypothetical protein